MLSTAGHSAPAYGAGYILTNISAIPFITNRLVRVCTDRPLQPLALPLHCFIRLLIGCFVVTCPKCQVPIGCFVLFRTWSVYIRARVVVCYTELHMLNCTHDLINILHRHIVLKITNSICAIQYPIFTKFPFRSWTSSSSSMK